MVTVCCLMGPSVIDKLNYWKFYKVQVTCPSATTGFAHLCSAMVCKRCNDSFRDLLTHTHMPMLAQEAQSVKFSIYSTSPGILSQSACTGACLSSHTLAVNRHGACRCHGHTCQSFSPRVCCHLAGAGRGADHAQGPGPYRVASTGAPHSAQPSWCCQSCEPLMPCGIHQDGAILLVLLTQDCILQGNSHVQCVVATSKRAQSAICTYMQAALAAPGAQSARAAAK